MKKKRVLVCITGGSGASLGLKLYSLLPPEVERFLVVSTGGKEVLKREEGISLEERIFVEEKNLVKRGVFLEDEIWAPPASGSFGIDVTYIVPTSMNTLAKIASGVEDNLITRAAGVAIKEGKKLILAPREMPFSAIQLENMAKLARLSNVVIAPPVIGYYSRPRSLEDLELFLVGRWLDFGGIPNNYYRRWGEEE